MSKNVPYFQYDSGWINNINNSINKFPKDNNDQ